MRIKKSHLRRLIREELLVESVSRFCEFWLASNGKWYMDLAHDEYGEAYDATTYGPFNSEEAADKYLRDNFSNPGGASIDDSGDRSVPTKSPDGSPVVNPRRSSRGSYSSSPFGRRFR